MCNSLNKLKHPHLWDSEKYVHWFSAHVNPLFRMPLPRGGKRSVTLKRREGESELDLFQRCKQERDALGIELWGQKTWNHMLTVKSRSVSRGGKADDETGVCHVVTPGRPNVWKAYWNERGPDGKRHQRSKSYSYGTPQSVCQTAEEAKAKAEAKRQRKEKDWYITDPLYRDKRKVSYREIFQNEIGLAITNRINSMSEDQWRQQLATIRPKAALCRLKEKNYTSIPVDTLLVIADQLGVRLELNSHPGPAHAE